MRSPGRRIASSWAAAEGEIKIHGGYVQVNAEVVNMKNFSAHADAGEIVEWIKGAGKPPRRIFITHGESAASDALRLRIRRELGWESEVPEYRDSVRLDPGPIESAKSD